MLVARSHWALQVQSPGKCFVDEQMGNFRVAPSLCFKPRLSANPIDMKMIFYSHANETHFHEKGFALSLVLKVRV